ncbi:diffusible signal factor-reguated Ax21 family protein [Lysobacter sp. LF1]|uniref:Diffusible signal factor-reguated Ax21 family protein n=1 Tax=Lysobacter stagni TaxID=3045172 RepID=A0ABT6XCT4_9GAMM|nr:diffusible signal factor-reguated Ax21 faimly protein [Lysobacter sp. LF1]MDI9237943.1 diffusible signal factor-reguated Ax21 family protein [Lysobacter sp. LF1]
MKRSLLALTLLAALPFAASAAEGVSYNYVEAGYAATNVDGDLDADGWAINGSAAIAPNFHLFGGYTGQKTDSFDTGLGRVNGVDVDQWNLGVGYNHEINSQVDLLTRVAYLKAETDGVSVGGVNFGGSDADGWSVEAGVRAALTPNFEGYAMAGYEDYERADGEFYGKLGAQVKFNQTWGVNGEVKFVDGYTSYFVGPRISF